MKHPQTLSFSTLLILTLLACGSTNPVLLQETAVALTVSAFQPPAGTMYAEAPSPISGGGFSAPSPIGIAPVVPSNTPPTPYNPPVHYFPVTATRTEFVPPQVTNTPTPRVIGLTNNTGFDLCSLYPSNIYHGPDLFALSSFYWEEDAYIQFRLLPSQGNPANEEWYLRSAGRADVYLGTFDSRALTRLDVSVRSCGAFTNFSRTYYGLAIPYPNHALTP